MSSRSKIEYDFGTGKAHLIDSDGERHRIPCFDFKCCFDTSEMRVYYWPRTKAQRKQVLKMVKEGEEQPPLDQYNDIIDTHASKV